MFQKWKKQFNSIQKLLVVNYTRSVMDLGISSGSLFDLSKARQRNIAILCKAEQRR